MCTCASKQSVPMRANVAHHFVVATEVFIDWCSLPAQASGRSDPAHIAFARNKQDKSTANKPH